LLESELSHSSECWIHSPYSVAELLSLPLALFLGLSIHLDWHLARHAHDGRSLGWPAHWLVAIPVFALAAWLIARRWPDNPWRPAALTVALGILLGQVLEPLGEIIHFQATLADELEPARLTAFAVFTLTGIVTMGLTLLLLRRKTRGDSPPSVP